MLAASNAHVLTMANLAVDATLSYPDLLSWLQIVMVLLPSLVLGRVAWQRRGRRRAARSEEEERNKVFPLQVDALDTEVELCDADFEPSLGAGDGQEESVWC